MGLPRLDALLSTDAAGKCGSNSTAPSAPFANATTNGTDILLDLGPLVLVEANISVTVDAAIDLVLPFLPPAFQAIGQTANIFSTGIPLVTACVNPADAFKTITGIVPAPTSDIPQFNLTHTATESIVYTAKPVGSETEVPCSTTSTHASIQTIHSTSTHTTIIYVPASSHIIKEPPISSVEHKSPSSTTATTELSTHTSTTGTTISTSETSLLKIPVQFPIPSSPPVVPESSTTSAAPITETPLVFTPPTSSLAPAPEAPAAPVVSMSPGFLIPTTNTSIVPVQQTDIVQFTGAAVLSMEISVLDWRRAGWQVGVVGASFVLGVLLL